MGLNKTETATVFSNTTRSVFYCSHAPHIIWDLQDTTSLAVGFCRCRVYNLATRSSFKRTNNHSNKAKERTEENFQYLAIKFGRYRYLVGSLCVPLSAVVGLLVSYQILTEHYICVLDFVAISSTVILTICSIFHLTMMAWERYVAIRKLIDYKVMVTQSLMKKLAIIAWVAAINSNCISTSLHYGIRRNDERQ